VTHPNDAVTRRRRPRAVIFDMDGLMLDTERLALRAWDQALRALGVHCDPHIARQMIGRNARDSRALVLAHHGADFPVDAVMRASTAVYDAIVAAEGIPVKAGLYRLLDWLESERLPRAVATSTRRERALAKLERSALLHRFDAIVGGDEVARGKPQPDIFLAAAARLRFEPSDCLVLEDSEPGVRAALAAGMAAIMVPDIVGPSEELLAADVVVLESLVEVRAHLASRPA
jgi:beta-phosphoglucomutase-like phosphatase (HAD superfamily)